jgi:hypothetical protein
MATSSSCDACHGTRTARSSSPEPAARSNSILPDPAPPQNQTRFPRRGPNYLEELPRTTNANRRYMRAQRRSLTAHRSTAIALARFEGPASAGSSAGALEGHDAVEVVRVPFEARCVRMGFDRSPHRIVLRLDYSRCVPGRPRAHPAAGRRFTDEVRHVLTPGQDRVQYDDAPGAGDQAVLGSVSMNRLTNGGLSCSISVPRQRR